MTKSGNIEEHLKGVSSNTKDRYSVQHVGAGDGTGLVDVHSEEAFGVQLDCVYRRWKALVPGFHK